MHELFYLFLYEHMMIWTSEWVYWKLETAFDTNHTHTYNNGKEIIKYTDSLYMTWWGRKKWSFIFIWCFCLYFRVYMRLFQPVDYWNWWYDVKWRSRIPFLCLRQNNFNGSIEFMVLFFLSTLFLHAVLYARVLCV